MYYANDTKKAELSPELKSEIGSVSSGDAHYETVHHFSEWFLRQFNSFIQNLGVLVPPVPDISCRPEDCSNCAGYSAARESYCSGTYQQLVKTTGHYASDDYDTAYGDCDSGPVVECSDGSYACMASECIPTYVRTHCTNEDCSSETTCYRIPATPEVLGTCQ